MGWLARLRQYKAWDKIPVPLAARLLGVSDTTIYRWLKEKEMVGLTPEDVRYMIIKTSKKWKRRPRGEPFKEGYDARRYDLNRGKEHGS